MKFHILKPFIFQALYGAFLFVAIPLILLLGPWIEIEIMDSIVFVFILVGIILYFNVILFEIIPGVYALVDLITDDFISQNVVFVEMYADRRRLFATRGEKKQKSECSKRKGILTRYEYAFFDLRFSTSRGKELFYSTSMVDLASGKKYTIQYGRLSKTIISITDDNGKECLITE